ncbi:MAG: hypothetical protein ACLQU2_05805 [Candidatus Binataceae bacterium]
MIKRASFRVLLVAVVGCFLAVAHNAIGRTSKHPASKAKPAARQTNTRVAGQIAYVGRDANIYVCQPPCDRPTCITCAAKAEQAHADELERVTLIQETPAQPRPGQYNWPTFSPDGRQIAYSSIRRRGGSSVCGIHSYDLGRRASINIFESTDRPIYFSWLPDGHRLFFLASDDESIKLILAEAREAKPVRIILTGQPMFFDWNQALDTLAFHYTQSTEGGIEQVGLMSITDHDQKVMKIISKGSAPFRSPAWSPDKSHLAYVMDNKNGQVALVVANADGSSPREMVGLEPRVSSFVWVPDSKRIAFATQKSEGKMAYDGVNLLDLASGNISALVNEPVIAYFFSPDGRQLAYIGTTEQSNTWNVVDLASGKSRRLANFMASHTEAVTYQVFDQYALSHRIWSPDSRALVFAGVMVKAGVAVPVEAMPPPSIWMLPLDGGPPQDLADGDVAFWSPVR